VKETIKKQSIVPRLDGVQRDLEKLKNLGQLPLLEFSKEDNFVKAQFYLRRALEGIFHIGAHVLSRIPGGRATEYEEIALRLGEIGVVPKPFAEKNLKAMAGYRNRLTHFYADVKPEEIHKIIRENLDDFDIYLKAVKELLSNPSKFNLVIE
jgi:uncharacterized protein YutE (UPF0331/DUF86 family)